MQRRHAPLCKFKGDYMRIVMKVLAVLALMILAAVGWLYIAPETALNLLVNMQRAHAGLDRKELQLADGLRYVYLEGGKGEPLLLLHGFGGNKDIFIRVAGDLTPHYRVIIPDHIGFGESAHPPDADYAPPAQAERLRRFVHDLGVTSLHLGGNSMGGHIALTYAALHPEEVKSLWLLDPSGVWSAPKGMAQRHIETTGQNPLLIETEDDMARLMQWVMGKPPFVPRPILNVLARQRIGNLALEERILRELTADSVEERVKGLATPALIVWGSEDRLLSVESAAILHRLLARSRVIVMPGTGHLPMFESPTQSARDYLAFQAALPR
jgi:pimeloyl-ACP methyl ester carboxylesterase